MGLLSKQLGENEVQAAIRGAVEVYVDRRGGSVQFFEPYANQQGAKEQRFAADLLAVLDNARVLMLEVKGLDVIPHKLLRFSTTQHAYCCALESKGVPIAYAYNIHQHLAYYDVERLTTWPIDTLKAIHRARPKILPGEMPDRRHPSLLHWLQSSEGGGIAKPLAWLLGSGATRPRMLTNAAMVLICSPDAEKLLSFDPKDAEKLVSTLASAVKPDAGATIQYEQLMREYRQVINEFHYSNDDDNDNDDDTTNSGRPRPNPRRGPKH